MPPMATVVMDATVDTTAAGLVQDSLLVQQLACSWEWLLEAIDRGTTAALVDLLLSPETTLRMSLSTGT